MVSVRLDSGDGAGEMGVIQVALSVMNQRATQRWYADVLGYVPTGNYDPFKRPEAPDIAAMQGVPGAAFTMSWAVDQQEFFQLEFFQYRSPTPKPRPSGWRPCDIGYVRFGVHVADFDAALERLSAHGVSPLTGPVGASPNRRACVRDPDGILVELMEDDLRTPTPNRRPRPEIPVVTRSVTASVADLDASCRFFVDAAGMHRASGAMLHLPEHEVLWGLSGADREIRLLHAGDFWLELVKYTEPIGTPWPDGYRICDQGIMNIALGTRESDVWRATHARVLAAGYHGNQDIDTGFAEENYMMDDQGFSLELTRLDRAMDVAMGFEPS
jgi:catechol 2,3-dioxygenase-like lactoylglutathione lyase family enzyme